jgi:hypothetical protein
VAVLILSPRFDGESKGVQPTSECARLGGWNVLAQIVDPSLQQVDLQRARDRVVADSAGLHGE